MIRHCKTTISLLGIFVFSVVCLAVQTAQSEETGNELPVEDEARQEILDSPRWAKAKQQFDDWLSIQRVYSEAQVEALESELRNRIAMMSVNELEVFLEEMEAKIAVLMSPASMDARRWSKKYTDKALQRYRKQFGVEDPMRMPAVDIESALREFAADRQSKLSASTAFRSSRKSQAQAARSYHQAQAKAASRPARVSAGHRTSSSSPYAPRSNRSRVRTYSAAYPKLNYSVGPWGGVWVNPKH